MYSQNKEFRPIYGSFSGREAIEVVTKNTQNMALKVPFNIGLPSIKRGGTKIKVTLLDYDKEQNVLYSRAVIRTMQITSPTAANEIITQTSSTVITNENHSSILAKSSITAQISSDNKNPVDQHSSQIIPSISNKSASEDIQSRPSSSDDYLATTGSMSSNTSSPDNYLYNLVKNRSNSTINFSRGVSNCAAISVNTLNGSNANNFQQNNTSVSIGATNPSSLSVQYQQKGGFNEVVSINGKASVWNGVNSKVINPIGIAPSLSVRTHYTNSVVNNQHQLGHKTLQYGPNSSLTSNNLSTFATGKMNTAWNGINDSLKEPNGLINDTFDQNSSKKPFTSNSIVNKDLTPGSTKHIEQQELDNKNSTSSIPSTPSSSRRSSESTGTNAINNTNVTKELTLKNNARQKKKKGCNDSKTTSGLDTPSQSNTPDGSRRSSTSNGSNINVIPSAKNVSVRQVEADSKGNMPSISNTPITSRSSSESNINQPNDNTINANKSWAVHLFPKEENQKPTTIIVESSKLNVTKPSNSLVKQQKLQKPVVPLTNGKPKAGGLAGLLKDFGPSFQNVTMSPRGLINNGNMCFMNAILQTLSHCPPFHNLLTRIYKEVAHNFNSKTPLVDSLVRFIEEYKQTKRSEGSEVEFGEAFSPEYVYDALRGLKRFDSMKGRQEDAEEFLGFLLDGLHEEFLAALKKAEPKDQQPENAGNQKDDDWMEVGRKNRASFTRTTDVEETPISRIFGGRFRSVLTCPGSNDSITLQPYQSLQLDIQPDDVKTIGDALKNLTVSECVDDFYSPKSGLVKANKRLYIETLPPILTLHLKRFIYDNVGGTQKLSKHIGYSTTLSIQPDIVAQPHRPNKAVEYRLFGVVYHHGKSATGGHYTADILCQNDWLHIDDTAISSISLEEVASVENPTQPTDRSAYILFYMRS